MKQLIHVLLVEDDEDDYILFQDVVSEFKHTHVELTWADGFQKAMASVKDRMADIFIVDFQLRGHTGIEFMHEVMQKGIRKPFIILTGQGDYDVDLQAMRQGASDFIEKDLITAHILERAIRYAIEHANTLERLRQSQQQVRMLYEKLLNAQEAERKKISKDLHDSIGSNLAALKFGLEKQRYRAGLTGENQDALDKLIHLVQDTITETRRIYSDLRPNMLDDLGILKTIQWFCRRFREIYSEIEITTIMDIQEEDIPEKLKIIIYRILQEALNNIVKHSNADTVKIKIKKNETKIEYTINDNGRGFDFAEILHRKKSASEQGIGLLGMKERVLFSGGDFFIRSNEDIGTSIMIFWPVGS